MLTLFLSASVPSPDRAARFRRTPQAAFEIEQAVISLARAVFARGGRLVFGGHPTISPLIAMVAGEYRKPRRAESGVDSGPASVVIYQSEAYREIAEEGRLLVYQLESAAVVWTPAVGGERYDPARRGAPQCEKSLEAMRRRLLIDEAPDAMVCIGGMEGVLEEFKLFKALRPNRPAYALQATGGAAAELAEAADSRVRVAERDVLADLQSRRAALPPTAADGPSPAARKRRDDEPPVTPYPLIFQALVEELLGDADG